MGLLYEGASVGRGGGAGYDSFEAEAENAKTEILNRYISAQGGLGALKRLERLAFEGSIFEWLIVPRLRLFDGSFYCMIRLKLLHSLVLLGGCLPAPCWLLCEEI